MANNESVAADRHQFKAEIRQLLDILVHSLYKEREIFLRELISNASDALTQMHFEMLTNPDVLDPDAELAIHLIVEEDEEAKRLIVKDTGIGMTREQLVTNLGTIAQSGAREFLKRINEGAINPSEIIGQFGVGFYSVFMVADEVRVISRSFREDAQAAVWTSTGGDEFAIEPADKTDRGTEVHITLKTDAAEFANPKSLRQIVKRHSDFVGFPIYIEGEQANQQQSLWRRPPTEIEAEEYRQFYQQLTMDFEEPLVTIHLASDAPLHVRALLFVPANRDKGVLSLRREPGLKLYSHNVLIQEYSLDLLPKWLSFVDGVVDSEDLPLNVSRETVQNTRIMRQLAKTLRHRVVRELATIVGDEPEKYDRFWNEFGIVLKEGLLTESEAKDDLMPLLRFRSTHSGDELIGLETYIGRMAPDQEEIYFVLGQDPKSVAYSPHLDPFQERGLEVLYLTDPIDAFVVPRLSDYQGKHFRNVDDPSINLPPSEVESEELAATERPALTDPDFNRFIGRCVTTLGSRVTEVRKSNVLRTSPVRLVSPDEDAARDFHRIYRHLDQDYTIPKKILEINRRHPLIVYLARLVSSHPEDELINLAIEQLYESALVIEDLHPNPSEMLPRIERLMEIAAERSAPESTEVS